MSGDTFVVCSFESRRATEMRSLIERCGGVAVIAPSMQEVPLEQNSQAFEAIRRVVSGEISYLVLLTGVGTEAMLKVAASQQLEASLLESMKRIPLLVRGPKPAAVLRRLGLRYAVKAPEPNTWQDLLTAIDNAGIRLNSQVVAVQEYGIPNPELYAGLEDRGATVVPVPVYRWALPNDIAPLKAAIHRTIQGEFGALLFTSAQQVRHVLDVAEQSDVKGDWLAAAGKSLVASIGPTCSDALRAAGLAVGFEARPPKMGPLVRGVMDRLGEEPA